jgi:hypothetical protein
MHDWLHFVSEATITNEFTNFIVSVDECLQTVKY